MDPVIPGNGFGGTMTTMGGPTRSVAELTAADIMSAPAVACREEAYFEEVAELLADREISGLPVVDAASRVVGVVSERDLAHALGGPLIRLVLRRPVHSGPFLRSRPHALPIGAKRASDIMTSPAIVADPEMPLRGLAQTMLEQQINRIPIVHLVVSWGSLHVAICSVPSQASPITR